MLAIEPFIGFLVELGCRFGTPCQGQKLPHHAKEGLIGLPEKPRLHFSGVEEVQRQTLLHIAVSNRKMASKVKSLTPIPSLLENRVSLEDIYEKNMEYKKIICPLTF